MGKENESVGREINKFLLFFDGIGRSMNKRE